MDEELNVEAGVNVASDEDVATMKVVAGRSLNAEKMAWTLSHILERRPKEKRAHMVLAEELHDYLSSTASMVKAIQLRVLSGMGSD